jgi:hypothetical protein
MSHPRLVGFVLALGCAGCGPGAHTRAGGGVGSLSVHEVVWNPTLAAVGRVQAVADDAEVTVVFADTGATVLSTGAVVAVDRSRTDWVDAAVIPSADGSRQWIVGLSRGGQLYRLKDSSRFEAVSARYGVEGEPVRSVAFLGQGLVGFLLAEQVAIADGSAVTRYGSPGFASLLGGGGYGVGLVGADAFVFHATDHQVRRYALPGVRHAALNSDGQLYASTARAIYASSPGGDLVLAYDSQSDGVGELTAARDTVWFSDGRELGALASNRVLETNTQPILDRTKLSPAANGDIWAISAGTLRRFSRHDPTQDRAALWASDIAPLFARVCAGCHEPNGIAGIDLSTADAWQGERIAIHRRVIETRTMPPQGHELLQAERAAIEAWSQDAR